MNDVGNRGAAMDVGQHGLKQHDMKVSTVVFMIFCLVAAGAYGIEEMIPEAGAGLTIVMLLLLPIFWSTPFSLVAAELGSARPQYRCRRAERQRGDHAGQGQRLPVLGQPDVQRRTAVCIRKRHPHRASAGRQHCRGDDVGD